MPRPGTPQELLTYAQRDLEVDELDDLAATVDGIVHAAAVTPADQQQAEMAALAMTVNLCSLSKVFRAITRSPRCQRLMVISSSAVYDQSTAAIIRESDADGGLSFYGATKFAAETVARRWCISQEVDYCAVRPTSLIGPGETMRQSRPGLSGFLKLVVAAVAGRPVTLSRPESRSDWLSVDDAAEAVSLLWRKDRLGGRALNLSVGNPTVFADVAAAVSRAANLQVSGDAELVVDGGTDLPASIANELIAQDVGWRAHRSLEDVVVELVNEGVPDSAMAAVLATKTN